MKRFILIMSTLLLLLMPVTVSAAKLDKLTIPVVQDYEKAQEVLNLINAERGKRGLRKLKLDKTLTKYAVTRAAELCVMVPWKSPHRRPNGKLNSSTKNVVYECCEERTRGAYDTTANSVVQNWMSSPSHRAGILLSSAKSVGVGFVSVNMGYSGDYTLEFSNKPARSMEKSRDRKPMNIQVSSLRKYLPQSAFSMQPYEDADSIQLDCFVKTAASTGAAYCIDPANFTWESSNPSVATVGRDGSITVISPGNVTFAATYKSNPKIRMTVSCTLD